MGECTLPLVPELSVEETIRREYNSGEYEIVLDMAYIPRATNAEKVLFLLLETIKNDEGFPYKVGDRFVYTIFYHVRDNKIVYRTYSEAICPAAHSCPMQLLQQLTPTTNEGALAWRRACWSFWQEYTYNVAPNWHDTPGQMQNLFLAMLLSTSHTVVCFHKGHLHRIEWVGSVPSCNELRGLSLLSAPVYRSGIHMSQNTPYDTPLAEVINSLIADGVPVTHGWIALDQVSEG